VLERFGTPAPAPPGAAAVRLRGGAEELAGVVRQLDAEDLEVSDFQLHAPTLDDVFLSKTGRKLAADEHDDTGEAQAVPA
jgi:ABC-2 type transport system ATP-binding protein